MSKHGLPLASEILVIDDEEDIRDLIAGLLRDEGFETRVAGDSESALGAVRQRRPQLVVLDIWLQGSRLDGLQLLDMAKTEHPDPQVLAAVRAGQVNVFTDPQVIARNDRMVAVNCALTVDLTGLKI